MLRQLAAVSTFVLTTVFVAYVQADEPLHPAVEAFFNSNDPFIRETILPNVEQHRKADAVLRVCTMPCTSSITK